jgi:hypothetical protein
MIFKFFKTTFIILTLVQTSFVLGQNAKLKAQLILVSGDTLQGHVLAEKNIFYENMTRESSYNQRIRLVNESGEKLKLNWKQVKKLELIDLEGKQRVFIQKDGYPRLLEIIYQNKVSWYKNYYYNAANYTQDVSYEIFDENGVKYSIGVFNSKKNKLESLCKDKTLIISFINNNKMTDENILTVLTMYESDLK